MLVLRLPKGSGWQERGRLRICRKGQSEAGASERGATELSIVSPEFGIVSPEFGNL